MVAEPPTPAAPARISRAASLHPHLPRRLAGGGSAPPGRRVQRGPPRLAATAPRVRPSSTGPRRSSSRRSSHRDSPTARPGTAGAEELRTGWRRASATTTSPSSARSSPRTCPARGRAFVNVIAVAPARRPGRRAPRRRRSWSWRTGTTSAWLAGRRRQRLGHRRAARAGARHGRRVARAHVVFVSTDGGAFGWLGAAEFARALALRRARIVAVVNLDALGGQGLPHMCVRRRQLRACRARPCSPRPRRASRRRPAPTPVLPERPARSSWTSPSRSASTSRRRSSRAGSSGGDADDRRAAPAEGRGRHARRSSIRSAWARWGARPRRCSARSTTAVEVAQRHRIVRLPRHARSSTGGRSSSSSSLRSSPSSRRRSTSSPAAGGGTSPLGPLSGATRAGSACGSGSASCLAFFVLRRDPPEGRATGRSRSTRQSRRTGR